MNCATSCINVAVGGMTVLQTDILFPYVSLVIRLYYLKPMSESSITVKDQGHFFLKKMAVTGDINICFKTNLVFISV